MVFHPRHSSYGLEEHMALASPGTSLGTVKAPGPCKFSGKVLFWSFLAELL